MKDPLRYTLHGDVMIDVTNKSCGKRSAVVSPPSRIVIHVDAAHLVEAPHTCRGKSSAVALSTQVQLGTRRESSHSDFLCYDAETLLIDHR